MKALKISVLSLLIVLTATPVLAGGWGLGASIFDWDYFGVQGRKTFNLGGDISQITTAATFYFDNTWMAFDADYHFVINPENPSRFYPLVGVELSTDFSDFTEFGVNLGGGLNFMMTETLAAWAEAKFVISDLDGFVISAGVMF